MEKHYKQVEFKELICPSCGNVFLGKGKTKYCSPRCKRSAQKKRNKSGVSVTSDIKICKKCGKKYSGQNHKYCSRECFLKRNLSISPDGIILKKCTKCKQIKPVDENYYHSKISFDGFMSQCKICNNENHKQWMSTKRGKRLIRESKNRNIETIRQYNKKILPDRREAEKIRRKTDLSFALKNRIRILMYHSLRSTKNGHKWQELVGYSIKDLRHHLEKQFTEGMTWERFLNGEIHIDHKIPVSIFNFTNPEHLDFQRCWALKNLQPMWAKENISKSNKLQKSFQPALAIGEIS